MEAETKEPKFITPVLYRIGPNNKLVPTIRPKEIPLGWVIVKKGSREYLLTEAQAEEYYRTRKEYFDRKASETRKKKNKRKMVQASKKRNRS